MKKIVLGLLGLGLVSGSFAGNTVVPANEKLKINTSDIIWQYNFSTKKCFQPPFENRQVIINAIRSENAQITEKYMNDAGNTYQINYVYKGDEYRIMLMNTYGECRFYQDLMIKDMDVDSKNYVNLTLGK